MTRNAKPEELPRDLSEYTGVGRELVVDHYLSHAEVSSRVLERSAASAASPRDRQYLTHHELACLYAAHAPQDMSDSSKRPDQIQADVPKYELICRLADVFGYRASHGQDRLRKSQCVHILLALAHDDAPDPFSLPSDPDYCQQYARDRAITGGAD